MGGRGKDNGSDYRKRFCESSLLIELFMTKKQKIWLGVFVAMFVLPEILWSPVGNSVHDFLQDGSSVGVFRPNFLMKPDNSGLLLFCLAFQLVGIISSTILIFKAKINSWVRLFLILVLVILLMVVGLIFLIGFSWHYGTGF